MEGIYKYKCKKEIKIHNVKEYFKKKEKEVEKKGKREKRVKKEKEK